MMGNGHSHDQISGYRPRQSAVVPLTTTTAHTMATHLLTFGPVKNCRRCSVQFSRIVHKNQCRKCEDIICSKCSTFICEIDHERPKNSKKVRVCVDCCDKFTKKKLPPGSPLTIENLANVTCIVQLSQPQSVELGTRLGLTANQLEEIRAQDLTSDLVSTVIKLWLKANSHPCWRQLIYALDCTVDGDTVPLMKCIRHCAEPPKDPTLTPENVYKVMCKVVEDYANSDLGGYLGVPASVITWINHNVRYMEDGPRKRKCAIGDYWLNTLPDVGWPRLAGALYVKDELAAMEVAQQFLPEERDSTLTVDNLMGILADVEDWNSLKRHLEVKLTNRESVLMQWCPTETLRRRAVLNHWLLHHPAPSWALVAMALDKAGLQNLKQLVASKYVIVEVRPLSEQCKWTIRKLMTQPSPPTAELSSPPIAELSSPPIAELSSPPIAELSKTVQELPLPRHLQDYLLVTRPGKPSFQPLEYGNRGSNDWYQTYVRKEGARRIHSMYGLISQLAKK